MVPTSVVSSNPPLLQLALLQPPPPQNRGAVEPLAEHGLRWGCHDREWRACGALRVQGVGCGVWGVGFGVRGLEFGVEGLGFGVWGLRVEG